MPLAGAILLELLHVQVAPPRDPTPQIAPSPKPSLTASKTRGWEDPHHSCAPLYLLVETLLTVGGADAPPVRLRESQARKALLYVLLYVFGDLGMAFAPAVRQLASEPQRHFPAWRREHSA